MGVKKTTISSFLFFPFKICAFLAGRYSYESYRRKRDMTKHPKMDLILSERKFLTVNSYCNKQPHTPNLNRNSSFLSLHLHLHPKFPRFSMWVWFLIMCWLTNLWNLCNLSWSYHCFVLQSCLSFDGFLFLGRYMPKFGSRAQPRREMRGVR